jgi:FkbM family methyltransferase
MDFIQLGANIGKSYSDIMWWLVPQEGWSGIFVEPNPDAYEKLIECYADLENCFFEEVAVVPTDAPELESEDKVVRMKLGNPTNYHETSKVISRTRHLEPSIANQFVDVPCTTLEALVEKHNMTGKAFELLQIDIEYSDYGVIVTTDFRKVCPKYIRVETIHMENYDCDEVDACEVFPNGHPSAADLAQKAHLTKFLSMRDYKIIDDPWYEKYAEHVATDFPDNKPEAEKYNTVYFKETL